MNILSSKRRGVNAALNASPSLSGNMRHGSTTSGLQELTRILAAHGFSLDIVRGDTIIGDRGIVTLPFRPTSDDSATELPQVTNSFAVFSWTKLDEDRTEVLAYLS
jgi:hypothetical protein